MNRLLSVLLLLSFFSEALLGDDTGSDAGNIRVMSFNIRYGSARDGDNHWNKRKEFVAETITRFDPDLLGTQETLEFQKTFLQQTLNGYSSVGVGRDDGSDNGEMTALFYKTDRFEKLDEGYFWLSETSDVPGSVSWDSSLTRMASWLRLMDLKSDSDRPILFINTHFDHKGKVARNESAKLIRKMAGSLGNGCDIVLTGDFNAAVESKPYQSLFGESPVSPDQRGVSDLAEFLDTYRAARRRDVPEVRVGEGTFSGFREDATEGARIDWIATAGSWKVLAAGIDRTARDGRTPSDHFPVTATLHQLRQADKSIRIKVRKRDG